MYFSTSPVSHLIFISHSSLQYLFSKEKGKREEKASTFNPWGGKKLELGGVNLFWVRLDGIRAGDGKSMTSVVRAKVINDLY